MEKQRRRELIEQYNQIKTYMGVYKVSNNINKKVYIASTPNLKNHWVILQEQLDMGRFPGNIEFQKEWMEFGKDAFTFELLEEKEVKENTDVRWEVKQMEKGWLEKLQPYGEKGYNRPPR
jgi:hypothetical protein